MTVSCSALLGSVLLCLSAPVLAQVGNGGAIRVETKEVMVPVLVLDKRRVAEVHHMKRAVSWHKLNEGDFHFLERIAVRGLTRRDFTILQDGREQRIVSVASEWQKRPAILTDNLGKYRELVSAGGGTWAMPLWEDYYKGLWPVTELPPLSGYEIGYTPLPSSDGSCHKLQITVDRPNSLVFSRSEYCYAARKGANPLQGTRLWKRIESELEKRTNAGEMPVSVEAIPLLAKDGTARVRIVLDYPSNPAIDKCTSTPEGVAIIGTFLGNGRREILQFSDELARMWEDELAFAPVWETVLQRVPEKDQECLFDAPFRYESQVEIPPGRYRLQVGLMDGKKFGRATVSVTVPSYHGGQLSISGIVLARRFRDMRTAPPESPSSSGGYFPDIPMKLAGSPIALPENYTPLVSDGVEITPAANTRFRKNSPFCFFFQIYEPLRPKQPQPKVEAVLRIVSANTGKVVKQIKPVDAAPYTRVGNSIIPIGRRIDVSSLPSGSYRLEVQATSSIGETTPWRSATFTVN